MLFNLLNSCCFNWILKRTILLIISISSISILPQPSHQSSSYPLSHPYSAVHGCNTNRIKFWSLHKHRFHHCNINQTSIKISFHWSYKKISMYCLSIKYTILHKMVLGKNLNKNKSTLVRKYLQFIVITNVFLLALFDRPMLSFLLF